MIDLKYEILEYLYSMPQRTATLADMLNIDVSNCDKRYWAIKDLADERLIAKLPGDIDRYRLSKLGRRMFLEERDKRIRDARTKFEKMSMRREKTSRYFYFVTIALSSVVGWLIGHALIALIESLCK
ncbi:MAG: hypothetical protein IJD36_01610 [Clostridia bacterium]|nr:hypothetical protein [Clostridia bacterium]